MCYNKSMIWLIDYTTYDVKIAPELAKHRADYFRVKSYHRFMRIGKTAPVGFRTFANGILRLATILTENGVPCRYLGVEELESAIDRGEELPPVVAFSAVCPTLGKCARLARKIKQISPDTQIYVGGPQVNNAPVRTREKYPEFDKLIVGHEKRAAELLAGRELRESSKPLNYDLLPHPLTEYAVNTFSAIGCPFSCNYCADGRAPKVFVSDDCMIGELKKYLPERTLVHVFDSVFGYERGRALKICKNLQEEGNPFLLSCDMRAELLSAELVEEMWKAGFKEIRMGIESADEELLSVHRRALTAGRCIEACRLVREHSDMYVTLYSVTGLPGTTKDGQKRTCEMFAELLNSRAVDEIKNAFYVPYPYDYMDESVKAALIDDEDWEHYDRQSYPVFHTKELSREELWELYLTTQKTVADEWRKGLGFSSYEEIPIMDGYYSEYAATRYRGEKKGEET